MLRTALAIITLMSISVSASASTGEAAFPMPAIDWAPLHYFCVKTATPPSLDGSLDDEVWRLATWTEDFQDIEGAAKPAPRHRTRVKMLWDDDHFYIAAQMDEPHVWAKLEQRDAVIYHDNDFEVFIDPDGDSHLYYELEINAMNTVWDLLLIKPYRDGGPAVDAWDIAGLRTAVRVDGSLNDPGDTDRGWSVEIALPWEILAECAKGPAPPEPGDRPWRVNFSRVQWRTDIVDGGYEKAIDPATGNHLPENNWVWSPQGLVNMHYPEMWGFVHFHDGVPPETERLRQADPLAFLSRQFYYKQQNHRALHGRYAAELAALEAMPPLLTGIPWHEVVSFCGLEGDAERYTLSVAGAHASRRFIYRISEDGRAWVEEITPASPPTSR